VKDKLEQKISDVNQLSFDKNKIFNNFEQFKYQSYKNIVNMQTEFDNLMNEKNNNLNNIMNE
jgi:hypothetical protein